MVNFEVSGNELVSCEAEEKVVYIPEGIKTIKSFCFTGLDVVAIVLNKDLEIIEENAFIGLSKIEIIDCRKLNNLKVLENIDSKFLDSPFDICFIVNDENQRDSLSIDSKFLFFTDNEFYEPDLGLTSLRKKWFVYDFFTIEEDDEFVTISDFLYVYDVVSKIKGIYFPSTICGKKVRLFTDRYLQEFFSRFGKPIYIKFPMLDNDKSLIDSKTYSSYGNFELLDVSQIHLSRNGNFIPDKFLNESTVLTDVYIPDNYKIIDGFKDCKLLRNIEIQDFSEITNISSTFAENSIFMNYLERESENYSCVVWKNLALKVNPDESVVTIPDFVEIIADNFCKGRDISRVVFNKKLKTIGKAAFKDQMKLNDVYFPCNLKKIDNEAFFNTRFKIINIPDSVKYIGTQAFKVVLSMWNDDSKYERDINFSKENTIIGDECFDMEEEDLPFR